MSIVMNLYYTGKNRNARKFAEEMESSGTADRILAGLREKYDLTMKAERYITDEAGISEKDKAFIRQ